MTEKDLEAVVKFSFGVYFPKCHALWKHHADEFSGAGHPDFYGHVRGQYLALELKVSKNYFSPAQRARLSLIQQTGGLAFGLLYMRDTEEGYLLAPEVIETFSYKDKSRWIRLLPRPVPGFSKTKMALDLSILESVITQRSSK